MRRLLFITILVIFCCSAVSNGSETPRWHNNAQIGQPLFVISAHRRLSLDKDKFRVDIIVEVMNDMLLFVRDKDEFTASVQLNLSIIDPDVGQVVSKVRNVTKRVSDYEMTNSRRDFSVDVFSVELPVGKYTIKVQIEDRESRKRETVEERIELQYPSSDEFDVSDIIWARSSELEERTGVPLHPTVSGMVSDPESVLYCYFDLFRQDPSRVCSINLIAAEKSGIIRFNDSLSIVGGERLSSFFMAIPCKDLTFNRYNVTLRAFFEGDTIQRTSSFSINFHGLPWMIGDINQAIQQLRYVATIEEIQRLSAAFPSKKEELFIRFWNEKFPCENEAENGKMIEYYNRVNYANVHFGSNRHGWETDRGKILIIYGKPSEIEKSGDDMNSIQFEIWYYNHINKRFVFKDEFGFNEYRLVSTIW
ncbi:GWxTD domain-containing protein [bacterium]|nr:GWxTD domain-containing protein [bacterium]